MHSLDRLVRKQHRTCTCESGPFTDDPKTRWRGRGQDFYWREYTYKYIKMYKKNPTGPWNVERSTTGAIYKKNKLGSHHVRAPNVRISLSSHIVLSECTTPSYIIIIIIGSSMGENKNSRNSTERKSSIPFLY